MLLLSALAIGVATTGLSQENRDAGRQGPGGQGGGQGGPGGGRNFDPAQMRERFMDSYKERLEITDDAEWKAVKPLVEKVMEKRMSGIGGMGRGFMGRGGRGGDQGGQGGQGGDRNRTFGQPNPDIEALQKAVDAKASNADLKAAIEKAKLARKAQQEELEKAQADLRAVLSVRQEALAMMNGLL